MLCCCTRMLLSVDKRYGVRPRTYFRPIITIRTEIHKSHVTRQYPKKQKKKKLCALCFALFRSRKHLDFLSSPGVSAFTQPVSNQAELSKICCFSSSRSGRLTHSYTYHTK